MHSTSLYRYPACTPKIFCDVLGPQVVEAVSGAIPVLVDGGFRRGTDIFKALALGAKAVMVRPLHYLHHSVWHLLIS